MANKKISQRVPKKKALRKKAATTAAATSKKKSKAKAAAPGRSHSGQAAIPAKPTKAGRKFQQILAKLSGEERKVQAGRMMSSPGIVRNGKVFAFIWNDDMVFRLGKGFDPATLKVSQWRFLNPFKDKPPMKGWFVVPPDEINRWERLARAALEAMRAEQEK